MTIYQKWFVNYCNKKHWKIDGAKFYRLPDGCAGIEYDDNGTQKSVKAQKFRVTHMIDDTVFIREIKIVDIESNGERRIFFGKTARHSYKIDAVSR